jgi:hypothetical protein
MQIFTKTLLVTIYLLVLLARFVNLVLGRDRLRLGDVSHGESFWIDRCAQPNIPSYFSEQSCSEGGSEASAARPLTRLLRHVARLYRPPRETLGGIYKASAEREQGIPDEVYTLW